MTKRLSRRGGFTLIELLAVMGIIALLSALTAAGVSRARSAQKARNTEGTVSKLQLALDQQWMAVIDRAGKDKAKKTIPAAIVTACGNDWDKAGAVWAYALTRTEFPNNFFEATQNVKLGTPTYYTLPARSTFKSVTGAGTAEQESAALLYMILADKGISGMNFNADDATNGAQTDVNVGGTNYRAFSDAYGTPIAFIRYAAGGFNNELDAAPYANTHLGATNRDPLDPLHKLTAASIVGVIKTSDVFAFIGTSINGAATNFTGHNRQPAVISAGTNMNFDLGTSIFGGDNVVGYRLRRQGARGD